MNEILCVTCAHSLRETGKMTADMNFAYCSICEAVYVVVPIIEENGQPRVTPEGDVAFYLNPVKPGRPEFAKDLEFTVSEQTKPKPDFSKLLEKIQKANTPKDLTD